MGDLRHVFFGAASMRVMLIGHFKPLRDKLGAASHAGANDAQRAMQAGIRKSVGPHNALTLSMSPHPAWPKGRLFIPGDAEDGVYFAPYVNIHVLRDIIFSTHVIIQSFSLRPHVIIQYNSYLFANLSIILLKIFLKSNICLYIQDVNVGRGHFYLNPRKFMERLALHLAKSFDLLVLISAQIASDFSFSGARTAVFQGAPTKTGLNLSDCGKDKLEDIAVYAGSLSEANGFDILVKAWVEQKIPYKLHVFGRGPLNETIQSVSEMGRGSIIFHGYKDEDHVSKWIERSTWNFCLRYDRGINQKYFFPSKFFNVCCAPGAVVVNDFHGIPDKLRDTLTFVHEDLSNLRDALESARRDLASTSATADRRRIVQAHFNWDASIQDVLTRFGPEADTIVTS